MSDGQAQRLNGRDWAGQATTLNGRADEFRLVTA